MRLFPLALELLGFSPVTNCTAIELHPLRRSITILVLSVLVFLPLSASSVGSAAPEGQNPDNRKLISTSIENLVAAWNDKNSEIFTKLFLPDAVLVMPSGNETRSRNSIRQRLVSEWQGKLKDSKLSHAVEAISFQGTDAVVKGKYRLDGMNILGFETAPEGLFVLRHKKQQGRWMIAKAELLRKGGA